MTTEILSNPMFQAIMFICAVNIAIAVFSDYVNGR